MSSIKNRTQRGFSLVEIAIVLVIVGLLIGGILRGEELITAGRVRNITNQQQSIQAAYYAFQDRYKMLPGDLTVAQALLVNNYTAAALDVPGDGWVPLDDSPQFFNNLAQAGFLACSQCMTATAALNCSLSNCPVNVFGQTIGFAYPAPTTMPATNAKGTYYLSTLAAEGSRAVASTGAGITSSILAEVDRKLEDGAPAFGQFRFSDVVIVAGVESTTAEAAMWNACLLNPASATYYWATNPSGSNCQGVLLL